MIPTGRCALRPPLPPGWAGSGLWTSASVLVASASPPRRAKRRGLRDDRSVAIDFDTGRAVRGQPGGEAPPFAGRHGPLELGGEAVHVDLVVDLASHHAALAPPADRLEAGLLVGPDAHAVPRIQNRPFVSRRFWRRTGRTAN